MSIGSGGRYIINDKKPDGSERDFSFNLNMTSGVKEINL